MKELKTGCGEYISAFGKGPSEGGNKGMCFVIFPNWV
jgi:hypothetical protein